MALDHSQQLSDILKQSGNVLILLPADAGADNIGAAWALARLLEKKEAEVTVAYAHKTAAFERIAFLTQPKHVIEGLAGARDFVLAFNTHYNKIMNVRTERAEEELRIFITPEKGAIDPRDFSFIPAKFVYDLVVVLGAPDKESLGRIYEENPDIFYEVPVVNIDNHSENEKYGQVNIIDITASSVSEITADLLEIADKAAIDEYMADCLLTGVIEATNSFQRNNTSPKTLKVASMLMSKGADQQKIIRHLYKTQPLSILKLWGRVMARMQWESDELQMVWAPVYLDDFVQSRSTNADIAVILDKVKENYANGKIFMVLYSETPEKVKAVMKCAREQRLSQVAQLLGARVHSDICTLDIEAADPLEAGHRVVEMLRSGMRQKTEDR